MFADRHGVPRILPDTDGRDAQYARFCMALRRELDDAKEMISARLPLAVMGHPRRAELKRGE